MRKVVLIIAGVAVVLCGAGGWFVYQLVDVGGQIAESSITRQEFDAQQLGTAETTVRDTLPTPMQDSEEDTLYGKNDPTQQGKPVGATCVYYAVKPLTEGGDRPFFRFCFAGGKLTEKKQIRAAGV